MVYKVGLRTLNWVDPQRSNWAGDDLRPLVTEIWYPAAETAIEVEQFVGLPDTPFMKVGWAARDAEFAQSATVFPLILLSHGTGGAALDLGWLATFLAARGYIVAGVNHHGNTSIESYMPQGFIMCWERPRDLTVMLDQLLEDPQFGARIDRERIGAIGFSLGGYTVIALAGGQMDLTVFDRAYKESGRSLADDVPPEFPDGPALVALFDSLVQSDSTHKQSYRDQRVRAAFAIAPVLGEAFTPAGLAVVEIPVKIVVGEADFLAPPKTNAILFTNFIRGAELEILLDGVGHYTFIGEGTEAGKAAAPVFRDPPTVDRRAVHLMVAGQAVDFFEKHLVTE